MHIASCNIVPVNNKTIHMKIFLKEFCCVTRRSMCGQETQTPLIQIQLLFNEHLPKLIFFKSILSRKSWQGGGELLLKMVQ